MATRTWLVTAVPVAGMVLIASLAAPGRAQAPNRPHRRIDRANPQGWKINAQAGQKPNAQLAIPDGMVPQVRELQGLAIAPVPLDLTDKDPVLVARGSYLVNTAGCNDCHTWPNWAVGGNPYLGQTLKANIPNYLAGGREFVLPSGATVKSRNITPDPTQDNKPAGMEFDEFQFVLRTGTDTDMLHPEISPLLQVMVWPLLGRMTDDDLRAIYEYLRSIPHAEPAP